MIVTKLAPFFQPIKPYTACVLEGLNAGRVVTVTALARANPMLTYCEYEETWSVEKANHLQRV
jgi:hypothetical protein